MTEMIAATLMPIGYIIGLALVMERILHSFLIAVRFVRYITSGGGDAE